jgi:hypothetical protein
MSEKKVLADTAELWHMPCGNGFYVSCFGKSILDHVLY